MPITRAYAQAAEPGNFFVAGKNKIINGDFSIWQRGTSGSVTNSFTYLTDRFWSTHNGSTNGTITISRQAFTAGQTDVPNNPLYFARITNTTLGTSQTQTEFGQFIEDVNTFAGQTVTFSFYVKASGTFTLQSWAWQGFGSGGSSSVFTGLTLSSSTTTTSWQRITATVTVPSVSGKTIGAGSYLGFYVRMVSPTAGSTIDFSNWQVEAGAVATPFSTATGTLAGELAACQRYYWRQGTSEAYGFIASGFAISTTEARGAVQYPVPMRTNVVTVDFSTLMVWDGTTITAVTGVGAGYQSQRGGFFSFTVASGLTNFRPYVMMTNNNTAGYLGVSAEL